MRKRNPLGSPVHKPTTYEIVGVLEEKGQNMGGADQMVWFLTVAQRDEAPTGLTRCSESERQDSVAVVELMVKKIFEARYGPDAV